MYVLFPPDLENFKLKGVGTFTPIPFFHTQLCWPFLMYLVQHFAYIMLIFTILIFLGTIVSSFGDNFFSLEAPCMETMLSDFYLAGVHCL